MFHNPAMNPNAIDEFKNPSLAVGFAKRLTGNGPKDPSYCGPRKA
jgi:hypothetical protein